MSMNVGPALTVVVVTNEGSHLKLSQSCQLH